MKNNSSISILLGAVVIAAAVYFGMTAGSGTSMQGDVSTPQREEIKQIVREVFTEDPKLAFDAIVAYRDQQMAEAEGKRKEILATFHQTLDQQDNLLLYGNLQGDVTVVEFFDYQCGYCKKVFTDVVNVVDEDQNVRLVLKEMPILGPASRMASEAAIAANKQGKYFEMHRALMEHKGRLNDTVIFDLAQQAGLDIAKLKEDMKSDDVNAMIETNLALANTLDVRGTPAFVIGDQLVPGAMDSAELKAKIQKVRNGENS